MIYIFKHLLLGKEYLEKYSELSQILWKLLKNYCDSSRSYKTNHISDKTTCILQPIPPNLEQSIINCMRNLMKPFFENYTIKHSILRTTFDGFSEWTIISIKACMIYWYIWYIWYNPDPQCTGTINYWFCKTVLTCTFFCDHYLLWTAILIFTTTCCMLGY